MQYISFEWLSYRLYMTEIKLQQQPTCVPISYDAKFSNGY